MATTRTRPSWTVDDRTAVLADPAPEIGAARLDLHRPEAGLSWDGPTAAGDRLLGLDLRGPVRLADAWSRGGDLTVVYETADARHVRASAMWRSIGDAVDAANGVRAWEVIVSAQTSLLHSDATLAVTADLGEDSVLHIAGPEGTAARAGWTTFQSGRGSRAILVRRTAAKESPETSVVVALHADEGDGIDVRLEEGRARIVCRLFRDTLEKGVLLRSRVLAAVGPARDDTTWASALVRGFAALPPMLDT